MQSAQLVTIDDLYKEGNNWKEILADLAWLGEAYEAWKAKDTGFGRTVDVHLGDSLRRSPGLHASEINTCVRQAAYSLRGEQRTAGDGDSNMQMRFNVGTAVHSLIQDDLEQVCNSTLGRISFEPEVKITSELGGVAEQYDYSSSCDGVLTFCRDNGSVYLRVGLEIKTMSADQYAKSTQPKLQHIQQATLYQKCLDLPLMWFLYYNKSNSNWTRPAAPWVVPFNKNEWVKLQGRSEQAHKHAERFPDREEGMHCRWCPFSNVCEPATLQLNTGYKATAPRRFSNVRG